MLAAILLTSSAIAQSVPKALTYQGKLTDATGQPVSDGIYQVQFKLYTVAAGGGRAGWFQISNAANSAAALEASTVGSGSAVYATTGASGRAVYAYKSEGSGAAVEAYTAGTGRAGYFRIDNSGSSGNALEVTTNGSGDGISVSTSGSGDAVYAETAGTHSAGYFRVNNSENTYPAVYASTNGKSNAVYGYQSGTGHGGSFTVSNSANSYAAVFGSSNGIGVYTSASGTNGWGIHAKGGSSGYAGVFDGNVLIRDRSTLATLMELGTGLDYAEGFDVSEEQEVAAGSVLVIDSDNPGKLTLSSKAYDRRVAGIVAGAKGLGSGVRLGADQFDRDVALAGRVYCNVDATKAAVAPGDLLTTSSTPGYAMKVCDYHRAQGATLGKAMQPLAKGKKRQILVLVALQ